MTFRHVPKSAYIATSLALLLPSICVAQTGAIGRVEGMITEKGAARLMLGASITVTRVDSEPTVSLSTKPDGRAGFRIDSLPTGRYMVEFTSPSLDSLGLTLPPKEVRIDAGQTAQTSFVLPVSGAIRNALCGASAVGKGMAVVMGQVVDADTERPIAGADVIAAWQEIAAGGTSRSAGNAEHDVASVTGPRGDYRLCGVPAGASLSLQVQNRGRAGTVVQLMVSSDEGAVVRNLSMSMATALTIAALDSLESTAPADSTQSSAVQLTGTAGVAGVVRNGANQPLADAEVRVANARPVSVTDAAGKFTLSGLPGGTQALNIRRVGYGTAEVSVELRAGQTVTRDVQMQRVVSLDSMRVVVARTHYSEFEDYKKNNFFGKYLTREEVQQRKPTEMTDLIYQIGGFKLLSKGVDATVISTLAMYSHPRCKESNVVIDGVEKSGLNYVKPSQVAAIAVFKDGATAPAPYRSECGLILIWTHDYQPAPRP